MTARPNLLYLYTDEQRYDTLAAYGNRSIVMPNLDALAEESTVVEQAYVSQPVCTPSRATMLTGLTPHRSGCVRNNIPLPDDVPCLPEMLVDDYTCAHHGKWHLGDEIFAQHGFGEWIGTEDTYHNWYKSHRDQAARSHYDRFLRAHGCTPDPIDLPPDIADRFFRNQIHRQPEELSRPTFLAGSAARFIREQRDRPWALYVNWLEPHMPFHSCRDDQYDPADVTLPAGAMIPPAEDHTLRAQLQAAKYRADGFQSDRPLADEAHWRRLIARYWGMCSLVDTAIGRILDELRRTGQWDNTIIVFTSDHGDLMGAHNLVGKGYMYEDSVRVPWMVKLPGQHRQHRVTGPVSQTDMVPTLLDAMGQPRPAHLDGTSRLDLIADGGASQEDAFIEWTTQSDADATPRPLPEPLQAICTPEAARRSECQDIRTVVTTDGYKYNHSSVGEHELFDLTHDPAELHNLIAESDQAERIRTCKAKIRTWQERTGDVGVVVE